ncbi:hypothetical protein DOS84_07085 [Flavobacterium aquariorum]|uniref:Uncharacterized protein n=1 Tax=Flavobacterium aquariorum TaxID=2217670 RepID=A0A2W7TVQ4_9FLAO|nr:hypothetical protein DOS84_07085 [Flavobacterium aquariorum]
MPLKLLFLRLFKKKYTRLLLPSVPDFAFLVPTEEISLVNSAVFKGIKRLGMMAGILLIRKV